jgi:holo-[acyl-carrier protein] synthase
VELSTGIDMIEIVRVERAIARHGDRFFRRFFTAEELTLCQGRADRLAGRIAVKEAVAKALGTGVGDFNWTDIEIVTDNRGKPELVLHNNARELACVLQLTQWSVSLAHTATHAIGIAVAQGA